jgi:hypothetical protein
MSPSMFAMLKRIAANGGTWEFIIRCDQRRLRGLYLRRYVSFTRSNEIEITEAGLDALRAPLALRKDKTQPLFLEIRNKRKLVRKQTA